MSISIEDAMDEDLRRAEIELELLNDFYACWCNLHSLPRDEMHRKRMELAAQRLVDSAHAVAAYKKSLLPDEPEKPRLEVVQ